MASTSAPDCKGLNRFPSGEVYTIQTGLQILSCICDNLNTLTPGQDGCHFPDDIFKCIFLNKNVLISIKISLTFVPKGPINNIPALVQIMAWRRPGDKPLFVPMLVNLVTHICVTRPQCIKAGNLRMLGNALISINLALLSCISEIFSAMVQCMLIILPIELNILIMQ